MKRFLLSAALLAAATTAIQAHTLDGVVKDNKTGEPLIGTVIRVKELPNVSTTTGLDGTFTLHELPDKGKFTIIVSYMSYKSKEMVIDVAKKNKVDIPMDEDLKQLGEVVVTGHREYRSDRSAIETVKNAKEDWVIVVGHHPIYAYTTKEESERLDMQKRLLPILHKYNNVAIYACGHIHNFQHIQKKGDNIDYVVNSSSSLARSVKPIDGTVFCSSADGFSVFTVDKKQLRMSMIDKDGKIIHTISKAKK